MVEVSTRATVVADNIIFTIPWDVSKTDRLQAHDHRDAKVAVDLKPRGQLI